MARPVDKTVHRLVRCCGMYRCWCAACDVCKAKAAAGKERA